MKKNIIFYTIGLLAMTAGVASCVEDDSTSFQREYSTIEIFRSETELTATIGDTLRITVDSIMETLPGGEKLKIEAADPRFEYEWWTGYSRGAQAFIDKINDGYELAYPIEGNSLPKLVFLVRDENGLEYYTTYDITINSEFGVGFIVVDTKDEQNSQFHEIQHQYLYYTNSDSAKILRNAYKLNQGVDFQGLVSHVSYLRNYMDNQPESHRILVGTENGNISFLKGDNYGELKSNDDLFRVPTESYKLQDQHKGYRCVTIITEDGTVLESSSLDEKANLAFASPILTGDLSPYKTNVVRPRTYVGTSMFVFDELNNRFLKMAAEDPWAPSYSKGSLSPVNAASAPLFDYDNVGAYDALYMVSGYEPKDWSLAEPGVLTIMKSETADKYYAYMFKESQQRIVDLNNCTDFGGAVSYATSTAEKILYYAVDDKVHAVSLGGSLTPSSYVGYTATPGDKITDVSVWYGNETFPSMMKITDINNPSGDPLSVANTRRMLLVTTYNESTKEGKLTCVPIAILNSPEHGLEKNTDYHKVFGGFGRILATSDMYRSFTE